MGLSSTLFTGLSGLDVNQQRLNVIGNNIANVNTTAFKSSRVNFTPQFYITDSSGGPADADFGGTNPSQRGLGAAVSSVQTDFSAGAIQNTGQPSDLAIDGAGFFVVQNGKEQDFTRDGSFTLNTQSALVTAGGGFVQGFGVDSQGNIVPGKLGNILIPVNSLTKAQATTNATFTGNLNANGADSTGATIFNSSSPLTNADGSAAPQMTDDLVNLRQYDANQPNGVGAAPFHDGDTLTLTKPLLGTTTLPSLTLTVTPTTTVQDLSNFLTQGFGIDTNATIPGAPTPGVTIGAIAGQPANTSTLIITGNAGAANHLDIGGGLTVTPASSNTPSTFKLQEGQDAAGNVSGSVGEGLSQTMTIYDSLGTQLTIHLAISKVGATTNAGTTWQFVATTQDDTDSAAFDPANPTPGLVVGEGTINFDQFGNFVSTQNNSIEITRANTGASTPVNVNLDFHQMQALTSGHQTDFRMQSKDGQAIGTLQTYSIGEDGIITGTFSNGLNSTLGQVAVATFANPDGLLDKGGNLYTTGANSGNPQIGAAQQGDAGSVLQGRLEQSNVDLSAEFINMIVASTGFSAASRVITTSDQLIQDLLNAQR